VVFCVIIVVSVCIDLLICEYLSDVYGGVGVYVVEFV